MRIGFTGTRNGMTGPQRRAFQRAMLELYEPGQVHEWHDGNCIGADADAHWAVVALAAKYGRLIRTIGHPPLSLDLCAFLPYDVLRKPKGYLPRNRDIVQETELLVAAPEGPERTHSGTWSTVRFARRAHGRVLLVWPDGELSNA